MTWVSTNLDIFPQAAVDQANAEVAIMRSELRELPTPEQRRLRVFGHDMVDTTGITAPLPITPQD